MKTIFEWDESKARSNFEKHKISFDEASTIFTDPLLITFVDDFHSDKEERFMSIGLSEKNRVVRAYTRADFVCEAPFRVICTEGSLLLKLCCSGRYERKSKDILKLLNEGDEKAEGRGTIDNLILLMMPQGESLRADWRR